MLTEIQYRTFDDLLDSVRLDLQSYSLEGMINNQQLIKVAMRVNSDLGLKLNPQKSSPIEIVKGKGKLPLDFYVLNFALFCNGNSVSHTNTSVKTYTDGLLEGVLLAQKVLNTTGNTSNVRQYTTTIDILPGQNIINHTLKTNNIIVQAFDQNNAMLSFDIDIASNDYFYIISNASVTLKNIKVVTIGGGTNSSISLTSDSSENSSIYYNRNGYVYHYNHLVRLRIEKNKSSSLEDVDLNNKDPYSAYIKNGFLVVNFDEGLIYINYQGEMTDDDGNLLVMDHPVINEYYEYALKQRIFEDMTLSGEPQSNNLSLIENRLRAARNNALSYVNTPDFNDLKRVHDMNRKAQYHNYYNMFKANV